MNKRTAVSLFPLLLLLSLLFGRQPVAAQSGEDLLPMPLPESVTLAGTFQSVLGCPGDWQPECDATYMTYSPDEDMWRASFALPAGSYEYKAALNNSWDDNFGLSAEYYGPNIPLQLEEAQTVNFYFDHKTGWITDNVNSLIANVPGSYQGAIGCPGDWMPACFRSWLQDPDGDGIFIYTTSEIPAGNWEAKVAVNESWALNYGEDGTRDGPNIPFTVPADNTVMNFIFDSNSNVMVIRAEGEAAPAAGNIGRARAHWLNRDTIAWEAAVEADRIYQLHYDWNAGMRLGLEGLEGGQAITLTPAPDGWTAALSERFPHLSRLNLFKIEAADLAAVPEILQGQTAVSVSDPEGNILDATGLQIPGVLDDLYAYDGVLGVVFEGQRPHLYLWAPTAQNVRLHLFADSNPNTPATIYDMTLDPQSGVWHLRGGTGWRYQFYLYEVTVYAPTTGRIETNLVTDPYSFSLSMNSQRSQIVNLNDPALMPPGWQGLPKPRLNGFQDITLYELHVRDFSIADETVPEDYRGTFMAFTVPDSNGMNHLRRLSAAGLTHVHLLPVFDIATINENKAERQEPDWELLASFPPDSDQQQAILSPLRDLDGYNWGYDPYHFSVPEGSYSTDPDGPARIIEFRRMVQSLNENGLRLVMDVVYNHTNSSGQNEKSVLDRVVPGYYHRLNANGLVETSTCCQNTATEHKMMQKLMVDSLLAWTTAYKVDGYRFDLMGHHMLDNMVEVRQELDKLTPARHGVDGRSVYVYGEGWNFGEVANNARGVNATQLNVGGQNIGTFNDRLRDAARGGNPFGGHQEQGFINGLFVFPNETDQGPESVQKVRLLHFSDLIRVGLAGNLRDYSFENMAGQTVTGADVDYNGMPGGYTLSPIEHIVYVAAHDNETLFDAIQYKAPIDTRMSDRVRMHNMGMSLVALSQGIPFFHAGDEMLRSKSLDRDSYNSGDWFNKLDFTYQTNNWGIGLPPRESNESTWPIMRPLLGNPNLMPQPEHFQMGITHFEEMLQIRASSPLFRLTTAEQVQEKLRFYNTGQGQIPGLIVMGLWDDGRNQVDPDHALIVTLFNATPEWQSYQIAEMAGRPLRLHPIQANSADNLTRAAGYTWETGTFTVPPWTTAVFVESAPPRSPWPIAALALLAVAGLALFAWLRHVNSYAVVEELREKLSVEDTAGE
jgi:pullulanase